MEFANIVPRGTVSRDTHKFQLADVPRETLLSEGCASGICLAASVSLVCSTWNKIPGRFARQQWGEMNLFHVEHSYDPSVVIPCHNTSNKSRCSAISRDLHAAY